MTTSCLNCRRAIMIAGAVEHCRDGVIIGHTCGKSMRISCSRLLRDRKERPFAYRAIKRIARKALDETLPSDKGAAR